jgi:hypothetical protein
MADAIVRNTDDGERMWFLGGGLHTWKALSEETNNSMLVFEDHLERGKVTPMHVVGAGGFTFAPRGSAHAFVVTSERARLLCIQTPGSGQTFYRNASQPATTTGPGPVDFDRLREVAVETGATTILGPPPFTNSSSR